MNTAALFSDLLRMSGTFPTPWCRYFVAPFLQHFVDFRDETKG